MHQRIAYGRRSRFVASLLAAPLVFLVNSVAYKLDGQTDLSWAEIARLCLGFTYLFSAFAAFLFTRPGLRGLPVDGDVVLRIPPWRRAAFATVLPGFAAITYLDVVFRCEAPLDVVAALAGVAALCLAVTTERVAFAGDGVQRLSGLGPRHSIAWGDISKVEVSPASITIHGKSGKKVPVAGLWLDGYPELVVAVLERAPKDVLRALEEEQREQLLCIAELVDPTRAARHRTVFQGD